MAGGLHYTFTKEFPRRAAYYNRHPGQRGNQPLRVRSSSREDGGYVLITVLLALAVISLLGTAALSQADTSLKLARQATESNQALYVANAGIEAVLAHVNNGGTVAAGSNFAITLPVAPGVQGNYSVTFTDEGAGVVAATAVGTVGNSTRQITVRMNGSAASMSPVYQHIAFSNGELEFERAVNVCGDLYANGNLKLKKDVRVWGKTTAQDPASPCSTILGTGKVISAEKVELGSGAVVQGGWCDSTHYGAGYACAAPPQALTTPAVDFADLKNRATRWYVTDSAFCSAKPAGTCTVVSGRYKLTLSGPQTYASDLIYVEGDIEVASAGLTTQGTVTFVATGKVTFKGDVLRNTAACTEGATCSTAFVSQGEQKAVKEGQLWGIFFTTDPDGFTWETSVEIHGAIVTPRAKGAKNATLYPVTQSELQAAPGLPGVSTGSIGFMNWSQ